VQANDLVHYNGIITRILTDTGKMLSKGLDARIRDEKRYLSNNEDRNRAIIEAVFKSKKMDVGQRSHVAFSDSSGTVRQHEMFVKYNDACKMWVVALRWT